MLHIQPSSQVISMALPANDSKTVYVGTVTGLIKSTDGGINWVDLGPNEVPVLALAVTPANPNRAFVVSDEGAFLS